ncbi:hypothetical protein BJ508DRAFT_418203 [Ascobolus immersus RN42]|uniref:Uncharacterized protein n=1 Tax=Ascobolus immersus RN42 TaxID=1160509 RepID=A0A3N4HNM4_ASCIM|nr:hypothetical protein BJ508DRAFT_418203 [Ascobolus immersus RN42]
MTTLSRTGIIVAVADRSFTISNSSKFQLSSTAWSHNHHLAFEGDSDLTPQSAWRYHIVSGRNPFGCCWWCGPTEWKGCVRESLNTTTIRKPGNVTTGWNLIPLRPASNGMRGRRPEFIIELPGVQNVRAGQGEASIAPAVPCQHGNTNDMPGPGTQELFAHLELCKA